MCAHCEVLIAEVHNLSCWTTTHKLVSRRLRTGAGLLVARTSKLISFDVRSQAPVSRELPPQPMHLLLLIAIVLLLFGAVEMGVIPPFHAAVVLRLRAGELRVERGSMRGEAAAHVAAILRDAGVRDGYVAVTRGHRVYFSRSIPTDAHQQLRNVLLNHWR